MTSSATDYRDAARERMGDAMELKRGYRYPLAMYAAGVAVECMLRAFRHPDQDHLPHHDVTLHFRACDRDHLGEHVKEIKYSRATKGADPLKVACTELLNAALEIVTVGVVTDTPKEYAALKQAAG